MKKGISSSRAWAAFGAIVLVAGMLAAVSVPALAQGAPTTCRAKNLATGIVYTALQPAIDAATAGDTVQVGGVCVGNFEVGDLTLVGHATPGFPTPTLDGNHAGSVVSIYHTVTLTDLTITNGNATFGGGVYNEEGTLILSGSSTVSGNTAQIGGGIFNLMAGASMYDSSTVSGNTASTGGGIYNDDYGNVTLNGKSSVRRNSAGTGGGIFDRGYYGSVTLNDSALVRWNTASVGGGIFTSGTSTLTLNGSSSVRRNTATSQPPAGGGVYNGGGTVTLYDPSAVRGNRPDDCVGC